MKELDLLLAAWLDQVYPGADGARRQAFTELLELPDPELLGYLIGREAPKDGRFVDVVQEILSLDRA